MTSYRCVQKKVMDMSESWEKIIADIKQDVGRVANKIARGVAQIALQDLREAHSSILDDYYAGYQPVQTYYYSNYIYDRLWSGISHGYRRTGNLRKSIMPIGVTPVGKHGFAARVQVGSANMDSYINSTGAIFPASGVFDLIWNQSIRGLPPGYLGYIEKFNINTAPVGVWISGSPEQAMSEFVNTWGKQRGQQVADMVAYGI